MDGDGFDPSRVVSFYQHSLSGGGPGISCDLKTNWKKTHVW